MFGSSLVAAAAAVGITLKLQQTASTDRCYLPCQQALQVRPPFACAHGGDASVHPPNTAAAYAAAVVQSDCIEIDASLSLDHQLVSMHDRDLQQLLRKAGARVSNPGQLLSVISDCTAYNSCAAAVTDVLTGLQGYDP